MFEIEDNIEDLERSLSYAAEQQLPFAMALALNDTANDVKLGAVSAMERALDRPTPFTTKGLYVSRASKTRLEAVVGFKRIQASYIKFAAMGGLREPKGRALLVPVGARRNKYGNMPRGSVARLRGAKGVFVASRQDPSTAHLRPGIYRAATSRRAARKLTLLVAFEDEARYEKKFDFREVSNRHAVKSFPGHLSRRMQQALARAK